LQKSLIKDTQSDGLFSHRKNLRLVQLVFRSAVSRLGKKKKKKKKKGLFLVFGGGGGGGRPPGGVGELEG